MRTAEGLRRAGFEGSITLIGAEHHLPYTRPPLSKQILAGDWEPDRAQLRKSDKLDALDLDFVLGRRAVGLRVDDRAVELDDGTSVPYDDVVVATGAEPRRLPGTDHLPQVRTLRDLDDSVALRTAFDESPRVVIVGAGFIGCEVAAVARRRGLDVTVIEPLPAPMVRGLGPELGAVAADIHRANGVDLRIGVGVTGIDGEDRGVDVTLSDGSSVAADVVVIGIGASPRTAWLEGSGIEIADGVVCDQHLAVVGVDHVWAAGDVARWFHPTYGETVRFEHWTVASDHGAAVAAGILARVGERIAHAPVPYVWSDQYDTKIQILGRAGDDDDLDVVHGSLESNRFVALRSRDGIVTAAVGFSSPRALMSLLVPMETGGLSVASATELVNG